jgi:hypothetical protein
MQYLKLESERLVEPSTFSLKMGITTRPLSTPRKPSAYYLWCVAAR